ncbi:hypothetical protein BYT27DRAFT_7263512 [Phlegmacium glaucopus]|nr:hypothetical protein BYT27DRAFT_7263512 [Phlegmacium glaucopus]
MRMRPHFRCRTDPYSKIMLFQQFTALVMLMVFALQGATAFPHAARADPQDLVDSIAGNAGTVFGSLAGSLVPANAKDAAIKAAGGIAPP